MDFKEANMGYLQDLSGGDQSIIVEIVSLFLEQTPKDLASLSAHIADKNWEGSRTIAHHIKPTLGYVGAEDMRLEIQQIEELVTQPQVDSDQLSERFDSLSIRFDVLFAELTAYLDTF